MFQKKNIKGVKLIVYDFDGVMTDNRVLINQEGVESVLVNRSDSLAINAFKKKGLEQIILSTEINRVVTARAKKLGINVVQGSKDKRSALLRLCAYRKIKAKSVLYVGNDVNDYEAMLISGIKICPADAHEKILQISDCITKKKGGEGVIREIADIFGVLE